MPLLLQGLDALSRHIDKISSKDVTDTESKSNFNPLVWLAQYLLRNHPRYVKDHRTPMYERFAELANIERGRRSLLRRRDQMEGIWQSLVKPPSTGLTLEEIPSVFRQLDKTWYLDGALLEKIPKDFSNINVAKTFQEGSGKHEVSFTDFFGWFEEFVKTNDILRASAFIDAERRQQANEEKAAKAEEDARRREAAIREAMEQRNQLEEEFEMVTADMYINSDVSRIMNKGAAIEGVEEKEGGPPLQGEHIMLIRLMLNVWGCPVEDDSDGDLWNDSALASWQQWLQARGLESTRGVDKHTLRRLIDKDEFESYLQQAYPVKDEEGDDDFIRKVVEVRCFLDDEVDILVEAVDEDTGEVMHLTLPDHEVDELRQRLANATSSLPVLACADRVSGRIVRLMAAVETM